MNSVLPAATSLADSPTGARGERIDWMYARCGTCSTYVKKHWALNVQVDHSMDCEIDTRRARLVKGRIYSPSQKVWGTQVLVRLGSMLKSMRWRPDRGAQDALLSVLLRRVDPAHAAVHLIVQHPHRAAKLSRRITLKGTGDSALYVCVTQEDGHLIWSSPIYIFR